MALLLAVLLLLPVLFIYLLHRGSQKTSSGLPLPPGPKGLPLIGNLHQLDNSNIGRYLWQLSKDHGPLMLLRLGFKPTLVVSSAKMAMEVLKTRDLDFCSRPSLAGQHKLSYNGLDLAFTPYSAYWREMRKVSVVYLFNSNRVQSFRPIREEEVSNMLDSISSEAAAGGGNRNPVDLTEYMMSLTSTIICRIAFGKRLEGEENKRFHDLSNETQALFMGFFLSDYFPYMGWMDKLTGMSARLDKNFKEFDAFYQEVIDEHLNPNRVKSYDYENILDVLLQLYKDRSFKVKLTFDHIKAIIMNVFVAGTDTSAATVIWAMSFLMKNPEAMAKAQQEIRYVVKSRKSGPTNFVTEEDFSSLHYLKAVIKETFRIQPTETVEATTLCGYDIPAKTMVYVNAYAIGRDPEAWGDDPHVFRPERFLGSSIDYKGVDYGLIPFGAGRRICPGIFLGVAAVEVALANLLYRFDWEMPAGMKREEIDIDLLSPGIAVNKKEPLRLVPKEYLG
ncbi:Cytochrome P450 83B1 [Linum perenne]